MSEQYLKQCFDHYHCDKGFKHGYHMPYADIIEAIYKEHGHVNLLELGVWKGASTHAFQRYFTDCEIPYTITGVDLFERCKLFWVASQFTNDSGINLIQGNSQNPDPELLDELHGMNINLIIDDAQHTPLANRLTLEAFWDVLVPKGQYVIEDVWPLDEMTDEEKDHSWLRKHPEDYTDEEYTRFIGAVQDRDQHFSEFDLRITHPDSYMIKLDKEVPLC